MFNCRSNKKITFKIANEDSLKSIVRKSANDKILKEKQILEETFQSKLDLIGYEDIKERQPEYYEREFRSSKYLAEDQDVIEPISDFSSIKVEVKIRAIFKRKE